VFWASFVIRRSCFGIYDPPLRTELIVASRHHYKHHAPTALNASTTRKSEIRLDAIFSKAVATVSTENGWPFSFSIDVIATLSMPQGTI
jgi:hypothetical protein